jgi:hypothetical protein
LTLNGLERSVPGLVARAYHRVKCVGARNTTRSGALFCIAAFAAAKNLHQSFAGTKPCRSREQVLPPLIAHCSFRIHLAERWLMAT